MESITRKITRKITLGGVPIGGGAPISIQSMLNVKTSRIQDALEQLRALEMAGCDIARFSVMDMDDAFAIKTLKTGTSMPLVADIHFDPKLALAAVENGSDGLRINPGNIARRSDVQNIVSACRERDIPIRIGVNGGSLPKDLLEKHGLSAPSMVEAALRHIRILEELDYHNLKVSVKASRVPLMLQSYRLLSSSVDYPLHLGVTEAGSALCGSIKSSVAMGILLQEGIGDTIRVSLTAPPVQEVHVAREILKALEIRKGLNIVSCPTCGRTRIDLQELTQQVEEALAGYRDLPLTIAVMGCAVNGPGEAREADFGLAGGDGEALLFAHGEIVKKVPEKDAVKELLELILREGIRPCC
jgi:(E)-4-hydroxy-3-methylbut-2-enyl-diphosphate synthase